MSIGQNAINHTKKAADAGSEYIRATAGKTQDAMRSGLDSASASAQRFTDQVTQAYGITGEGREELARQGSQNLEVFTQASAMLTRGVQDLSREWFSLMQERLQKNLEDFSALARCQSMPDFMAVQSTLMRDNLERTIESTRRIAEVATRVANEANQTLTAQTKKAHRAA
jgi:phasin family protein